MLSDELIKRRVQQNFVAYEYNATVMGGIVDLPALTGWKMIWEQVPWTRLAFGSIAIMDPSGDRLIGAMSDRWGMAVDGELDQTVADPYLKFDYDGFLRFLDRSLARYHALEAGAVQEHPTLLEYTIERATNAPMWTERYVTSLEDRVKYVFDFEPPVRLKAVRSLGELGRKARQHTALVAGLLNDEVPEIQREAAIALAKIQDLPWSSDDPLIVETARAWWAAQPHG